MAPPLDLLTTVQYGRRLVGSIRRYKPERGNRGSYDYCHGSKENKDCSPREVASSPFHEWFLLGEIFIWFTKNQRREIVLGQLRYWVFGVVGLFWSRQSRYSHRYLLAVDAGVNLAGCRRPDRHRYRDTDPAVGVSVESKRQLATGFAWTP